MHFHSSQRFVALFAGISLLSTLDPQPVRAQQSPVITVQPTNQYPIAGGAVSFTVGATATMPLSYQWRKDSTSLANGGEIRGATTTTLTLSNLQTAAVND